MSITVMSDKDAPGAFAIQYDGRELWMITTHVGLVVSLGEVNGRDDSDFYAMVWNEENQDLDRITYASTRGWSYANNASVDATPDVLAKVKALTARREAEAQEHARKREASTPKPGRKVRFTRNVRGKHATEKGSEGEVFWFGEARNFSGVPRDRYMSPMQSYLRQAWADPRENKRVGVVLTDGRKVFVDAMAVEVTNA
jgi:hypothetical protein